MDFDFDAFERLCGGDLSDGDDDDMYVLSGPISRSSVAASSASAGSTVTNAADGAARNTQYMSDPPGPPMGRGRGAWQRSAENAPGPAGGAVARPGYKGRGSGTKGNAQRQDSRPGTKTPRPGQISQARLDSLDSAIIMGNMDSVKLLLSKEGNGIPVDRELRSGWTSLMRAASYASPAMVGLILQFKPDVNYDCGKRTALMVVCSSDSAHELEVQQCVQLLLESKALVNVRDTFGMTPLMMAAQCGRLAVCRLLLQYNASVAIADTQGDTALMYAARNGHLATVRLLVLAGADVKRENNDCATAETLAVSEEKENVQRYLEKVLEDMDAQPDVQEASDDQDRQAPASSQGRVDRLQMFLLGLQFGDLVGLFEEHSVTLDQLASMTEDDLAKIGVVDAEKRNTILTSARRLAEDPDSPQQQDQDVQSTQHKHMYKHQISHEEAAGLVRNLIRHLRYESAASAYLLTQLQTNPEVLELQQDEETLVLVDVSRLLRSSSEAMCDAIDDVCDAADQLAGSECSSRQTKGSSSSSAGWTRTKVLVIAVPAIVAVTAATYYLVGRDGSISFS